MTLLTQPRSTPSAGLGAFVDAADRADAGAGTSVTLDSGLFDRAAAIAGGRGWMVRRSAACLPGRHAPYTAIRKLFAGPVGDLEPAQRRKLFDGAASYVCALLVDGRTPAGDAASLVAHGIVWICSLLGEQAPLALLVDDPQHTDRPSLDVLTYLARHLDGLPVVVVLAET